jgi:hypothetical protein
MRKRGFSLYAVSKLVSADDLSEDWLFAVGEVHDFLLSDVPSNTAMRHLIAVRSALKQTEAAPIVGDDMVWLLPANEWAKSRVV